MFRALFAAVLSLSIALTGTAFAEADALHRLSLAEAVTHAIERSPANETASRAESAARARVNVVRAEALPRISVVAQVNRSTGNVVPGATFAMNGVPGVAGPPGATRFGGGAWQTAAGITAGWDVLELVRRPTLVDAAEAEVTATKAGSNATRLAVTARVVEVYVVVAEARAVETAAIASEARTKTFHDVVRTLVAQKLRPDLDLARADTDAASAHILVEKTRLSVTAAQARLAEAIGEPDWSVDIVTNELVGAPPSPGTTTASNPTVVAYEEKAKAADARASGARLGALPRIELLGAAWLRGGGYVLGGPNSGDAAGLLPDTPNWALGVVTTWTPTDIAVSSARATAENASAGVDRARASEAAMAFSADEKIARAAWSTASAIGAQTRTALDSARKAGEIAATRYTTGLGGVVEVADAERALAAAERDDALARYDGWRALAAYYRARGDLGPFLAAAKTASKP